MHYVTNTTKDASEAHKDNCIVQNTGIDDTIRLASSN
jgi:hypothetical protein